MTRIRRSGYALLVVLLFLAALLTMLSLTQRQLASALRIESVREQTRRRDGGSLYATALALEVLETGLPPETPYVCGVTVTTPSGPQAYAVKFVQVAGTWSITARPALSTEVLDPLPPSFAN